VILRIAVYETKEKEWPQVTLCRFQARFEDALESASADLPRDMVKGFAQRMMDADVEVRCNAIQEEQLGESHRRRPSCRCHRRMPGFRLRGQLTAGTCWRSPREC
jgi:hypothetical protein